MKNTNFHGDYIFSPNKSTVSQLTSLVLIMEYFSNSMRVFLTGNRGYVGNILSRMLIEENFECIGCDVEYYPQGFVENKSPTTAFIKKDIRNITKEDLKGFQAIIHLAALSNDPLGELNSSLTRDINYLATIRLAKLAKDAGIERFIFSSSCSTYGVSDDVVDESSPLAPITAYAKSKVDSERELLKLKDEKFFPVNLRNATAYGVSPSMRLDIVVNNLTCSAYTSGSVKLLSDGTAWRPLIHVEDMSRAFIMALKADENKISGETFNVGSNEENYTVREIAERVEESIPNSKIEYAKGANKDSRSYKVNFDKITKQFGYHTKWNLKDGIKEIYDVIKNSKFTEVDFKDKAFYRVAYIKWLAEQGFLDSNLYRK